MDTLKKTWHGGCVGKLIIVALALAIPSCTCGVLYGLSSAILDGSKTARGTATLVVRAAEVEIDASATLPLTVTDTPAVTSTTEATAVEKETNTPEATNTSIPTAVPTATDRPTATPRPTDTPKPTNTPKPTSTAIPTVVSIGKVGQRIELGGIALTVVGVTRLRQIGEYNKPGDGMIFVNVEVVIENVSRETTPYNPLYFRVKDADAFEYTHYWAGVEPLLKAGELSRGEKVRGNVTFEVQAAASGLVLSYEPVVLLGGYKPIRIDLGQ